MCPREERGLSGKISIREEGAAARVGFKSAEIIYDRQHAKSNDHCAH
jgi:hypothetical protein